MARARPKKPVGPDEQRPHAASAGLTAARDHDRAAARMDGPVSSRDGHATDQPNSAEHAAVRSRHPRPAHVLRLQRAVGNQTAGRVLSGVQRQAAPRSPPTQGRTPGQSGGAAATAGTTVTLYFSQNNDQPGSEMKKLDRLMLLATDPGCTIRLDGHSSTEGSRRYNQDLSERRASAIESYLLVMGVDTKRIERHAYGERRPAVREQGDTPAQIEQSRAQNRRVEVTLTRTGPPNRRMEGLQRWLNRTRDRFEKMERGEMAGLQKAQALLAKRNKLAGKIPPILVYDAERMVAYHEIGLKSTRATLAQLREAFANPKRASDVLRRRRSYFGRAIKAKLEWRVKSAAALRRARQALRSASTTRERAFWKEVVDLYKDSITRLTEDIFWLRKQQLEDEQTP